MYIFIGVRWSQVPTFALLLGHLDTLRFKQLRFVIFLQDTDTTRSLAHISRDRHVVIHGHGQVSERRACGRVSDLETTGRSIRQGRLVVGACRSVFVVTELYGAENTK